MQRCKDAKTHSRGQEDRKLEVQVKISKISMISRFIASSLSYLKTMYLCIYASMLLLLFTFYFLHSFACALELDTSVDDEIRKKYNPSKLEQDMALPALPKILQQSNNCQNVSVPNKAAKPSVNNNTAIKCISYTQAKQSVVRLKKGTRIKLKLMNSVADSTQKGAKLSFSSIRDVKTKHYTIPAGTVFKGYVVNSHKPQLSGNGGLIVININSLIINDEVQPISAKVIRANSKHIFRNKIKGKRTYIKSVIASAKPGFRFYHRMVQVSTRYVHRTAGVVVTPLSLASGVVVLGSDVIASPVISLFKKGGSVSLREGSEIEVKLVQDVFVYL